MAFPYLYPRSEKSPLDCSDYKVSWYLLRKQSVFAYKLSTGNYRWPYAEEDNIYMMNQYARLVDRTVNAKTCGYLQESPDVAQQRCFCRFFCDISGVQEPEPTGDWMRRYPLVEGYY